ncbi:MAG: nicotinate (nicotinamide) nucleotide adenylyltransferase [Ferruginibacter sp.]
MKIGLYFGSFNPIHNGHLIIATHVINNSDLDRIWFVVSPQNPFKESTSLLNEQHRLHLIKTAIDGAVQIKASNIEFKLPRPSYTIDTLTYLKEIYPQYDFSIIMGSDSFLNLEKWKNGNLIKKDYPIYVYNRPGFSIKNISPKTRLLEAPLVEISSTLIRELIKEGKSIRYLVPDAVMEEIQRNNYYREINIKRPAINKTKR